MKKEKAKYLAACPKCGEISRVSKMMYMSFQSLSSRYFTSNYLNQICPKCGGRNSFAQRHHKKTS